MVLVDRPFGKWRVNLFPFCFCAGGGNWERENWNAWWSGKGRRVELAKHGKLLGRVVEREGENI